MQIDNYLFYKSCAIYLEDVSYEECVFASEFLKEEIEKRDGHIICNNFIVGENYQDTIIISLKRGQFPSETFKLNYVKNCIMIEAMDQRGFLYGGSYILRKLYLKNGIIGISSELKNCEIKPDFQLRGHQLGYRDKQNTCPAWDISDYERYIRDLLIFGSNAIEILPPRTDDCLYSSHFCMDPFKMMIQLSKVIHKYGMEVHMWYPVLGKTIFGDEYKKEMYERENDFKSIPYLDGLMIPAGDPGELPPKEMFIAAADTAKLLHKYHPAAKVWIAPQSFAPNEGWYEEFYEEIDKEPNWLFGICHAPWVKDTIQEMYERLPFKYKERIKNYPDITHNVNSQFEVPDWDEAFSYTLGRESYNARPYAFQKIHELYSPYTIGSITYSEGIHDDVNKIVWGYMDYQKDINVEEILRDYVRVFIDPELTDKLAGVLENVEKSWKGDILGNRNIDLLYDKMMEIQKITSEETKNNFRYQMLLLRILGDYQTKLRYRHDQDLERRAYEILLKAETMGSIEVIRQAREIIRETYTDPVGIKERFMMQRLADDLYGNCHIQLTTTRHKGQNLDRGAWLDTLNMALNDSQWMNAMFSQILEIESEDIRLNEIKKICKRCDPGKGGQYIYLGDYKGFSHVKNDLDWKEDPGFLKSPLMAHQSYLIMKMYQNIGWYDEIPVSTKWLHGARTLYGTPLKVQIDNLDPQKEYVLTVTYQNILLSKHVNICLYAGEEFIHDCIERNCKSDRKLDPCYSYLLPQNSYAEGTLELTWRSIHSLGPCTKLRSIKAMM